MPWSGPQSGGEAMASQKSRSAAQRSPGALPAMRAALIAPIEVPAIQLGAISCSVSASNAPA